MTTQNPLSIAFGLRAITSAANGAVKLDGLEAQAVGALTVALVDAGAEALADTDRKAILDRFTGNAKKVAERDIRLSQFLATNRAQEIRNALDAARTSIAAAPKDGARASMCWQLVRKAIGVETLNDVRKLYTESKKDAGDAATKAPASVPEPDAKPETVGEALASPELHEGAKLAPTWVATASDDELAAMLSAIVAEQARRAAEVPLAKAA